MGNITGSHFKFCKNKKCQGRIVSAVSDDDSFKYINGRRYLKDSDKYIMPNDDMELDRLHLQHDMQLQIWQSHFSSPIETILKLGGIKVLDVGCGSGIWTLEMATNYPLSRFTGIDIASTYPMDTHPLNVTFESADVSEGLPFPDDNFDFIHIKCLLGSIPEKYCNAKTLFNQLKRILKPGGWIEVMECDIEVNDPGPTMRFICNSFQAFLRQRGINLYLCDEIPKILDTHGFIDIHTEDKTTFYGENGGTIGEMSINGFIRIILTLKPSLLEFTCINSEEFDNLLQTLREEVNKYGSSFRMYRFFAQKPLTYIL